MCSVVSVRYTSGNIIVNLKKSLHLFISIFLVCVHTVYMCTSITACVQRSEDFQELVLSYYRVGSGMKLRSLCSMGRAFKNPLSHLTSPCC